MPTKLKLTIILTFAFVFSIALFNITQAKTTRLVKTADDAKVYLVDNNRRVHIPNPSVFEAGGYKWGDIKTVSQKEMNNIPDTALIKSPVDAKVYLVEDGKKAWIPDEKTFLDGGLKWSDIVVISQAQVDFYNETKFNSESILEIAKPENSTQSEPASGGKTKSLDVVVNNAINLPNSSILENKSVEKIEDDQVKILQLDGTEADYSKSEETTSNIFLSNEKLKYLPDISALLKAYPDLNIQDVNTKGDFAGCIAKNDWDLHRAFAKIKGKFYEIGAIDGIYSCAYGINDKGQVVGVYEYKEGVLKAFLWQAGQITKLPAFNLKDGGNARAEAMDINNNGVIVGMSRVQSYEKSGLDLVHAVRWVNGQIEDLVKDKPYINSWAMDINERDQILINSNPASIWQNGSTVTINDLTPKLGEGEFVKVDGGFADEPEFVMDGSLRLRVDRWNPNIEIINGDEYWRPTLSHLRYYEVSLPDDISTIKTGDSDETPSDIFTTKTETPSN